MRRRSRLSVLVRLAGLEENRALLGLGEARSTLEQRLQAAGTCEEQLVAASDRIAAPVGTSLSVSGILANNRHLNALREREAALNLELLDARNKEDAAREAVAKAKLRVRGLQNAVNRREAAIEADRRRAEIRRMDEIQSRTWIEQEKEQDHAWT